MNIKQSYIDSHEKHINKLVEWMNDVDWIPEIQDNWDVYNIFGFITSQEVCIHIPFDRKMYKVVEDYFESIGWKCTQKHLDESMLDEHTPWTWMAFSNEDKRWGKVVMVRFDPWATGSVCTRKQIGTTTKEVPVYEFACE